MEKLPARLLLFFAALAATSGRAALAEPALSRYEYVRAAMGTKFTLVLYAGDEGSARKAADAAFARVEEINAVASDYLDDSELNRFSATSGSGEPFSLSDDLWKLLSASQRLAKQSQGAFDVTVGPYSRLWRRARRQESLPDKLRLAEASEAVGWKKLHIDKRRPRASLSAPLMKLDLGGIAKGYAADAALAVLREAGFSRAMVAAAGDIAVADPPPGKEAWRIAVGAGEEGKAPLARLSLVRSAVSTSGDAYQFVTIDGKRYSHIIDPRSGMALTTPMSVTVVAPDATTSDSLATALAVAGAEGEKTLLECYPGCEMMRIALREASGPDGKARDVEAVTTSPGFAKYLAEPLPSARDEP